MLEDKSVNHRQITMQKGYIIMRKDRNKKSLNTKAFAAAAILGTAAVAAASYGAYNRAMSDLTPATTSTSQNTWVFSAPEDTPANAPQTGIEREESDSGVSEAAEETSAAEAAAVVTEEAEEVNKPVKTEARNIMPVDGEVSHPYSNGELVKSETLGVWKTHDGCDILCPLGTDVRSMSAGTVTEINDDPLWGITVVIEQDNGLTAEYCGLSKELQIKAGSKVGEGEIIGKTSDTCQAEIVQEPHLHLGVKQGGKWIDPMSVISG